MVYNPTLRLVKGNSLSWLELDENFTKLNLELDNIDTSLTSIEARVDVLELNAIGLLPNGSTDGDYIVWNGATNQWLPEQPPAFPIPDGTAVGDVLTWDGASWISSNTQIELPATANTNDVLKWNGSYWYAGDPQSGILPTTANFNDVLTWDGSNWVPKETQDELPYSGIATGQVLTWNGTGWQGLAVPKELPASATLDHVLTWDGASWVAKAAASATSPLPTTANINDVLMWDGADWVANTLNVNTVNTLPQGNTTHNTMQWDGSDWVAVQDVVLTGTLTANNSTGTANQVLMSSGAGSSPFWATLASVAPSLSITNETLSTDGQIDFSNGWQVRWGKFDSDSDNARTITFPIAFSNECFTVVTSYAGNVTDLTATSFRFQRLFSHDNGDSYFIAFGR